jgi:hypothetical protein
MWSWLVSLWRWLADQVLPARPMLPPSLVAFLAGQSVRAATYLNQGIDPHLMRAADWPTAIHTTEQLIRTHIAEQARTIADLEAAYDALEAKYLRLEAEHERMLDALQGA